MAQIPRPGGPGFTARGIEGPGGFEQVLSNRVADIEEREKFNPFKTGSTSPESLAKWGEAIEGFIGPLVLKVPIPGNFLAAGARGAGVSAGEVMVLQNPTKLQVQAFRENTSTKSVRVFKDPDTGEVYVWDAAQAIHADVVKGLGIDFGEMFKTVRKTGKDLNDFIPELETSVDVERFFGGGKITKKGTSSFEDVLSEGPSQKTLSKLKK